ncbi:hypothetical protein GDO78_005575 [Eleutherodactylus coqui]|uniref:Uncharacterized protein n=1 Tax=Eleutherodactylus coqui TaxID=57060 RepID=A0A8J6FKM6_ELECQ|nr:hypothetical protein GDO78_005575 [Eleutherodactylus coqui]
MYRQKYRMEHLGRGIIFSQILQSTTEISAIVKTKWEISKTYINIAEYCIYVMGDLDGKWQYAEQKLYANLLCIPSVRGKQIHMKIQQQ